MSDDDDQPTGEGQELETPVDMEKLRQDDEDIDKLRLNVPLDMSKLTDPNSPEYQLWSMVTAWAVEARGGTGAVDADAINKLPVSKAISPTPIEISDVHVHMHVQPNADYVPRTTSLSVALVAAMVGITVLALLILLAMALYMVTVR